MLIHQPWSQGISGQATDVAIQAEEIINTRRVLNDILTAHTGQDLSTIERDTERDFYMTAMAARENGLIDQIPEKQPSVEDELKLTAISGVTGANCDGRQRSRAW